MTLCQPLTPSRRALLATGAGLFAWAHMPRAASAAGARDPRFITVILRGALDGLSAVGPVGDPDYAGLHGDLALSLTGAKPALPLDSFFALNPAMTNFHRQYRDGKAAVIHAVASPYRERSHFDGQDVLESGQSGPGMLQSGWLNRAIDAMPAGERVNPHNGALAVGPTTPLILRGRAPVVGWAPTAIPSAGDDLALRLMDLYKKQDPALARALSQGLDIEKLAAREMSDSRPRGGYDSVPGMRQAAQGAAKLLAADDGPRIAALAFEGWDTHANEGGATGRLAQLLSGLDGAFQEFETGLGPKWQDTTVVVITEFGRTARINGTTGTDHGTGTVAFLAGGAVKGGRVIANWPGLKDASLYQNRDLAPTTDLRAVLKGLLAEQFGLSAQALGNTVFPGTMAIKPLSGLLAV